MYLLLGTYFQHNFTKYYPVSYNLRIPTLLSTRFILNGSKKSHGRGQVR